MPYHEKVRDTWLGRCVEALALAALSAMIVAAFAAMHVGTGPAI